MDDGDRIVAGRLHPDRQRAVARGGLDDIGATDLACERLSEQVEQQGEGGGVESAERGQTGTAAASQALAGGRELTCLARGHLCEPSLLGAAVHHALRPPAPRVAAGRSQPRRQAQRRRVGPTRTRSDRTGVPGVEGGSVDAEVPRWRESECRPPQSVSSAALPVSANHRARVRRSLTRSLTATLRSWIAAITRSSCGIAERARSRSSSACERDPAWPMNQACSPC